MGAPHIGIIMRNLMNRLGYNRYYVQGGDWGSVIGTSLATFFPEVTYKLLHFTSCTNLILLLELIYAYIL